MTTRRNFLAGAAAFAAASGGPAWANQKIQLGIQLYTVRDDLAKWSKVVRDANIKLE